MGAKRYYRCPDCDHVLDRERYAKEEACPHCKKAVRAWGRAKARGEVSPGEELKLKADGPHALDTTVYRSSHYVTALCIVVLIPAVFFLAMPLLFTTQTEPTFTKAQYLAEYQRELDTAAAEAERKAAEEGITPVMRPGRFAYVPEDEAEEGGSALEEEAVPERVSEVMRATGTKRGLQQLLSLLSHGRDLTRLIGLLSGVLAGVCLSGLYLRAVRKKSASIQTNVAGFAVVLALLSVNLSAVRYARVEAVGVYEVSTTTIDDMVGFLLHQAIENGNTKLARRFISEAGALEYRDKRGARPLHLVVEAEMPELAPLLVNEYDVDIDGTDNDGATALFYAARMGSVDATRTLLSLGATSSIREQTSGRGVLHAAASHANVFTLKLLLEHGEDPNAVDLSGTPPILLAARSGNRKAMALLIEHGADPDIVGADGQTRLHHTLAKILDRIDGSRSALKLEDLPDAKLLALLLEHGANTNAKDDEGWTPLHRTARTLDLLPVMSDNLEVLGAIVRMLMERGADSSIEGPPEAPAYMIAHAARVGGVDDLRRICETDPSTLDSLNSDGKSALQMAIEENRLEIARFLLDQGADLAVWKSSNVSPLDFCVDRGDTELVALLLEYNCASAREGKRRGGPLHVAARNGNAQIVELLLKHGYSPEAQEARGNTALHLAAAKGCAPCVESLLANGADPTTWNVKGETPLAVARKANHAKAGTLLKKAMRTTQFLNRKEPAS